jgi:acyl-CoA synthetase (AMP-forming)/AMP-acid ligase II
MDVKTIIRRFAEDHADKTAIVYGHERLTFRQLNERSVRLANGLRELGVRRDDRIGTVLGNCPQYIEAMFAKHKINAVDVILSPRISTADLEYQINDADIRTLIVGNEYISQLPERSRIPSVRNFIAVFKAPEGWLDYEKILAGASSVEPEGEGDSQELGHIVYTSGTTGKPKGIMWRRDSSLLVARNILLDLLPDLNKNDIFLGLQPIYHAVSSFVLPCWMRGVPQVITPSFDAEIVFPLIEKENVSIIKTIPTLINRYIAHPDISKYSFDRIRSIIYGASPIATDKLKQAIHIFGRVFVQNYGQSEAPLTLCCLRKEEHVVEGKLEEVALLASVGRPYTMVKLKIVDEHGKEVGSGQPGEIIVQSDHAMMGYLNRPEETRAKLVDGWIHTGDIGKIVNGYVYLMDRKGEMIISGGLNIYPNEVEQVVNAHPAVLEACVFGVPDEKWQEAVKAAVVLKPGMNATEDEIIEFCKNHLASYKKPQSVDFLDTLPKNPQGKILRRELRAPYWKQYSRTIGG